jgi:hypothetical protein
MRLAFAFLSPLSFAVGSGLALPNVVLAQTETRATEVEPTPPSALSVTREEGAESCPDTQALAEHVQSLRGHQTTREASTYRVSFSRRGGVFRASIRVGESSGARVLRDRGQTCASLEQATALTLALLLDSDAHELPVVEEHEAEPNKPVVESLGAPPSPPPPLPPHAPVRVALSFGGAGLFGVVQTGAPAAVADVGVSVKRIRTSIGALWLPKQKLDFGPGRLEQSLLGGVFRACYAPAMSKELRFDLCSGIYAGLLRVQARGYTRNDSVDRAWLAVPLELSLSTVSTVGVELGASALVPLRQSDFAVDNLGTAYESWPVGLLLSLRAVGSWLL